MSTTYMRDINNNQLLLLHSVSWVELNLQMALQDLSVLKTKIHEN